MSKPVETSSKLHRVSETTNPSDHTGAMMQEAQKAGQAFLNEVQHDWQNASKWVKEHPREDGMIVGGALVVTGVVLGLKNAKMGEQMAAEGQQIMRGEQIVSESTLFSSLGREGSVVTKMKLGNQKEVGLWLDPESPAAKNALRREGGLGDYFKR